MPVITDYPLLQVELVRPGRAANPANTQLVESIVTEEDWEFLFPQVQCIYSIYNIYNIYSIYSIYVWREAVLLILTASAYRHSAAICSEH